VTVHQVGESTLVPVDEAPKELFVARLSYQRTRLLLWTRRPLRRRANA
jgi:hypothetical protein